MVLFLSIGLGLTTLSVLIWLWLLCFRGQFWQCDQQLEIQTANALQALEPPYPTVCAVVPARNEADLLPVSLRSLLSQTYPGQLTVILVDDHSTDGTADVAKATAAAINQQAQLQVLMAEPLPSGWSGKLWAMDQGVQTAQAFLPDYILLTDADIAHDPDNLKRLVAQAEQQELDLTSVMVRLRCESFWEKWLIPAFVFFFQKLYPFRWVNDPAKATAAAAGGCILIRRTALDRIGGLATIRQALIDDCALAQAVKAGAETTKKRGLKAFEGLSTGGQQIKQTLHPSSLDTLPSSLVPGTELSTANTLHTISTPSGKIWLGLSNSTHSLRPYPSLETIWNMVARTAYTQLHYSPFLLLGTLVGMTVVYLIAPIGLLAGWVMGNGPIALAGLVGWLLMTVAYFPTVRFYQCSPLYAIGLPAIAFLYTLMTIDSALRHWQGRGGAWKGRVY